MNKQPKQWNKNQKQKDWRTDVFRYSVFGFAFLIVFRLFMLQVIDHSFYQSLATGQHEIFQELVPARGEVLIHDLKDRQVLPVATNQFLAFVYADPRQIINPEETALKLIEIFEMTEAEGVNLTEKLSKQDDPYEPIRRKVSDDDLKKITDLDLPGIHFVRDKVRLYPEPELGGHVVGFVGANKEGVLSGKYGVEGFFDESLAGQPGFLRSEKDITGRLISIGNRSIEPAQDGVDIVLTIDRSIQHAACSALKRAMTEHQADRGSVIIIEPHTGQILALCGVPDFDPNNYQQASDLNIFNNPAIFLAYEPGSVFKPITIAAALDSGAVTPQTIYHDTGVVAIDEYEIKNSDEKANGYQTMTQALEKSLNTGMIFAMRETGQDVFTEYVKNFGFGQATEIQLDTEVAGNISSLDLGPEIYAATASFGQGITVTPLQIVSAYGAIANGGILKKPYIIDEIRYPSGEVVKTEPKDHRRVIETKTASLLGAMLVSVIEHGHGTQAAVEGYYIGGKTGTAQVAKKDGLGYDEEVTIGSFAGFGPVEDPKFAMIVRIDNPKEVKWAEATAAPVFGEIAQFLLQYFEVPPNREIE
ncbi:peptidoglycan D,D-transpeptidase FtsI family protein [Patescibacteria group bacterium]